MNFREFLNESRNSKSVQQKMLKLIPDSNGNYKSSGGSDVYKWDEDLQRFTHIGFYDAEKNVRSTPNATVRKKRGPAGFYD